MVQRDDARLALERHVQRHKGSELSSVQDSHRACRSLGYETHARHLSAEHCRNIGLKVTKLEDDHKLQKAVLSLHHSCIHTLGSTSAFKLIENHNGIAFIQTARDVIVQ